MVPFELEPDVPLQVRTNDVCGCVQRTELLLITLFIDHILDEPFQSGHVMCVSDCAGPHSRNHLSDLLHGPAAPKRQTYHVSRQRWSGQDHPGV